MSTGPAFVLVDKAAGWTSHDVVARARSIFQTRKIGHAGTLDPMATGLLVLGVGRATRLLRFVTDQPKEYEATACFGVATDSLDADGEVVDRRPIEVDEDRLSGVMAGFVGDILQVPPMVSAVRIGGKRLHELARRGQEVERPPRSVRVDRLDLEGLGPGPFPRVRFRVVGGSGLYVRVLADDIARALGGSAHLTALRRVRNGLLRVGSARPIEGLVDLGRKGRVGEAMVTPGDGLSHLDRVEMDPGLIEAVGHGRRIRAVAAGGVVGDGPVRMMAGSRLLAVYRVEGDELLPEVVLA